MINLILKIKIILKVIFKFIKTWWEFNLTVRKFKRVFKKLDYVKIKIKVKKYTFRIEVFNQEISDIKSKDEAQEWVLKNIYHQISKGGIKMETTDFKFELGVEVKHILIPFKGIIRGRYQYMTGCNQYAVQNTKLDKDGNPKKWLTFDENMIELVKAPKPKKKIKTKAPPGGPINSNCIPKDSG